MLSTKSSEFITYFDDLVERVLLRICGPAKGHFVVLDQKIPKIIAVTNGSPAEVRQSARRLVEAGRITEETRCVGGRVVRGVVCLPIRQRRAKVDWADEDRERREDSTELRITAADLKFLRQCGTVW